MADLSEQLLEALVADGISRGAERLTLAFVAAEGSGRAECCLSSWRGEEVLHRRPLQWRVFDGLVRRALLGAGLDPWQYRRPQSGTLAGRWTVSVEGENLQRRQVTLRPVAGKPQSRAPANVESLLRQLEAELDAAEAARAERAEAEGGAEVQVEDSPTVRQVNLMLREAYVSEARLIVAGPQGAAFGHGEEKTEQRITWTRATWPEVRRRVLYMLELDPWLQDPAVGTLALRFASGGATWNVDVLEGDQGFVFNLVERWEGEEPPSDEPTEAPTDEGPLPPLLRAVLEAPKERDRRHAYADWLLEQGDARGRFLALQLADRGADGAPPAQAADWCGALRELADGTTRFAWGFVDRIVVSKSPPRGAWETIAQEPHWATVRALKLGNLAPELAARVLSAAPLRSLEALGIDRALSPADAVSRVWEQLTALCVTGMNRVSSQWLDGLKVPRLGSLELELDEEPQLDQIGVTLGRFLALRLAQSVGELVIDARALPAMRQHLAAIPASVKRVVVPLFASGAPAPFGQALVCTLRRSAERGPFSEVVLHGSVDDLYRGAERAIAAVAGVMPAQSLTAVRVVSTPRALDRGREGVLRKLCATKLPGVAVEVSAGAREGSLWWLAETPQRAW